MGVIYCLTSPSGKKYIGQTKGNLKKRIQRHVNDTKGCPVIAAAIKKYGIRTFDIKVLIYCLDIDIDYHEVSLIKENNSRVPHGYNIRGGGKDGHHSEETKKQISDSKVGRNTGDKHPLYGKHHSEETKKAQSISSRKNGHDLPIHMRYVKAGKRSGEGYAIERHKTLKNKWFTSKLLTLDQKYNLAIKYYNSGNGEGSSTTR